MNPPGLDKLNNQLKLIKYEMKIIKKFEKL